MHLADAQAAAGETPPAAARVGLVGGAVTLVLCTLVGLLLRKRLPHP